MEHSTSSGASAAVNKNIDQQLPVQCTAVSASSQLAESAVSTISTVTVRPSIPAAPSGARCVAAGDDRVNGSLIASFVRRPPPPAPNRRQLPRETRRRDRPHHAAMISGRCTLIQPGRMWSAVELLVTSPERTLGVKKRRSAEHGRADRASGPFVVLCVIGRWLQRGGAMETGRADMTYGEMATSAATERCFGRGGGCVCGMWVL